jgi:hypothetical protein
MASCAISYAHLPADCRGAGSRAVALLAAGRRWAVAHRSAAGGVLLAAAAAAGYTALLALRQVHRSTAFGLRDADAERGC